MIKKALFERCKKYVIEERSADKLALSFCIGNYIAFSPFLFLHSVMVFCATWLFNLNFAITFAVAYGVNNPWTLVPIYTADYFFGRWLFVSCLNIDFITYNPQWMSYIHNFFEQRLGLARPCVWSFLLGGNILGILTSILLYPIMRYIFSKMVTQVHGSAS